MKHGTIYLLHFSSPYHHAKHYCGWTTNLTERIRSHAMGTGARLVSAVRDAGIDFIVASTWKGSRKDERRFKNRKNAPRYCPICQNGGTNDQ